MLRLIYLLAGLAATVTGACVPPFTVVGEGCYYFSLENGFLNLTWPEARQYCLSLGSEVDLAVLDYVCDDFRNIGTYLGLYVSVLHYHSTWIGATGEDDKWFWLDGRSFSTDSSYWYPGLPSSSSGRVAMGMQNDGKHRRMYLKELNATSFERPFVCQDFSAALQQ